MFWNADLLPIVWLFAKTLATGVNVFELIKEKIVVRLFQADGLALILLTFESVETHDIKLV